MMFRQLAAGREMACRAVAFWRAGRAKGSVAAGPVPLFRTFGLTAGAASSAAAPASGGKLPLSDQLACLFSQFSEI